MVLYHHKPFWVCMRNMSRMLPESNSAVGPYSAALVGKGEKVLLVDMDSQANCSKGLGIRLRTTEVSIKDMLQNPDQSDQSGVEQIIRPTAVDGLYVLPSNIYLASVEMELSSRVGGTHRLAVILKDIAP